MLVCYLAVHAVCTMGDESVKLHVPRPSKAPPPPPPQPKQG
jgi:hypothetical protein